MSLIRQIWMLLLGVVLVAVVGSAVVNVVAARESLRSQLLLKNADAATVLALALSQLQGDPQLMNLAISAQFDTGHYLRVALLDHGGSVLFERRGEAGPGVAPRWFVRALPIDAAPGRALVSAGWKEIGRVEVAATAVHAHDTLWRGAQNTVLLLALLAAAAAGVAALGIRALRRLLRDTLEQARALEAGRFITQPEPAVAEFKQVAQAMNSLVRRIQALVEAQAFQVEGLRAQVMADPLTGVPNRRHFMAQLGQALGRADAPSASGLLILRLRGLDALNARLGRDSVDRLLCTIAQALQTYPARVGGAFAGRLNGSDFGLFLPAPGLVAETAASLVAALRGTLVAVDVRSDLVVGGAELMHGQDPARAMAAADEMLARAESAGAFAIEVAARDDGAVRALGERGWHARIASALEEGRIRIGEFAVVDAQGRLLNLECPLRLQLDADGEFLPAAAWLAMAQRARLMPAVDRCAIEMALQAVEHDGQPRCVNIATSSIAHAGFIDEVQRSLLARPRAARLLWIEVGEAAAVEVPQRIIDASSRWRRHGTRLGIEHAGGALAGLGQLHELGLDYVKIGDRFVAGVASDESVRIFATSLVTLVHGIGLQAIAEGVDSADDLALLWTLGFDGATGPAVQARRI